MSQQAKFSICVLNYNGQRWLTDCFESLDKQTCPRELWAAVLVDNNSHDDSVKLVRHKFPWVRVITSKSNLGFAAGNNLGSASSQSEYVVFLNNDTKVDPNWLAELKRAAEHYPEAVCWGSQIRIMNQPDKINSAGFNITPIGSGYDRHFGESDDAVHLIDGYVPGVSGAAMMVRRRDFEAIGGFDPDYFMYFEDVDLCLRLWLKKQKIVLASRSIVYHAVGGTAGSHGNNFRLYYATRNRLLTLLKNYTAGQVIAGLVIGSVFDFINTLLAFRRRNWAAPFVISRAYFAIYFSFVKILKKRRRLSSQRLATTFTLTRQGVITGYYASFEEFRRLMKKRIYG